MKIDVFEYKSDLTNYDIIYRRDTSSMHIVCDIMKDYILMYYIQNVLIEEEKLQGHTVKIVSNLEETLLLLYNKKAIQGGYILGKKVLNRNYLKLVMTEKQRKEIEKWFMKNKILNRYPKV